MPPYRKKLLTSLGALFWIGLGLIICFYFVDFRIRPTLKQLAGIKAKQMAIHAINQAVRQDIAGKIKYRDLIHLQFNESGRISFIQPDTGEINQICSEATLAVQNTLDGLKPQIIKVPLGQLMGTRILAGVGPDLPVRVVPIGLVESTINDHFDQAGINQTRHRIYLTVKTVIKMVVPLVNQEIGVKTDILLTEAIIVGDVPQVFGAGGSGVILPEGAGK